MDDITRKILERIEVNTAQTSEQLRVTNLELASTNHRVGNLEGRVDGVEQKIAILIDGQHQLASNVALLNQSMTRLLEGQDALNRAMTRLTDEVKELRDDKYRALENRVAKLERHADIE